MKVAEARPIEKDETLKIIADLLYNADIAIPPIENEYVQIDGAVYEHGGVTVDILTRSGDLARVRIKAER